ncbi:Rgg/GadR/MutR family transcriptional regulator [Lactococcus muris]|uniref:Rgg/GadR/MutR family transcriptional regulator n=1 Tax=Lactococcus muris TaxID=2941330 RepID=A0ABV4DCW0_9LACT|nr:MULTISPECIES: Rgg/GadR/MutR family transcriptional regulator [Lactococcus]MBL3716513.1 Rgg/GadR/MutR family transcriptional regulator [Lactococcus garvieae]HAP15056.1 transcriptional regulator [Lactococcus sp.]
MQTNSSVGETYRHFRISKNFTLKEAAHGCISISQLSNFETGRSLVSCLILLHLLSNINVSAHEFFYHLHYQANHLNLLAEREIASLNNNSIHLKNILKRYEYILSKKAPLPKRLQLDKIRAELALSTVEPSFQFSPKNLSMIKQYLDSVKIWGEYEISLLNDIAHFLDLGTLSKFSQKMLTGTQSKSSHPFAKKVQILTSINVLEIFIKNKQKYLAMELIHFIDSLRFHEFDLFERISFIYQKAHFEVTFGNFDGLCTMKKCQHVFEMSESYQIAQKLEQEIKSLECSLK